MPDAAGDDGGIPEHLLEPLAQAIHDRYLADRLAEDRPLGSEPALRPWEDLPDHLKEANRAQAAGYPAHLAASGYRLRPAADGDPPAVAFHGEQLEAMARAEHARWRAASEDQGYRYGPRRIEDDRRHPGHVSWDELTEDVRDLDRQPLRRMSETLATVGLWIVPCVDGDLDSDLDDDFDDGLEPAVG